MRLAKRLFLSAVWCASVIAMEKETVRSPWFAQREAAINGWVKAVADNDDTLVCAESTSQGAQFYTYEQYPSGCHKTPLMIGKTGMMRLSPDGFYVAVYRRNKSTIALYSNTGLFFRSILTGANFDDFLFLTDTVILGFTHEKLYEHDINSKDQSFSSRFHRQKPQVFKTNEGQLPAFLRVDDSTIVCTDGEWGKGHVCSFGILQRGRDAWQQTGTIPVTEDERLNARLIAARNGLILLSRRNRTQMVLYRVKGERVVPLNVFTVSGLTTDFIDGDIMSTERGCVLLERALFIDKKPRATSIWYFCADGAQYTHAVEPDADSIICSRSSACAALIPSKYGGAQSLELFGEEQTCHDTREARSKVLTAIRGLFQAKTRLTLDQVINKAVFNAVRGYVDKKGMVYAEDFPAA